MSATVRSAARKRLVQRRAFGDLGRVASVQSDQDRDSRPTATPGTGELVGARWRSSPTAYSMVQHAGSAVSARHSGCSTDILMTLSRLAMSPTPAPAPPTPAS